MATNPNWLSADDWHRVQRTVPIACTDVVPVTMAADGTIAAVGLIHRDTPHQGRRWCIVGGRTWRDESFAEAAARQLRETLGPAVEFRPVAADAQPDHVAQYFTTDRTLAGVPVGLLDPRQHAITTVFVVPILGGTVAAGGEALAFRWFDPTALPSPAEWGFRQDEVAAACLRRRGARFAFAGDGPRPATSPTATSPPGVFTGG